MAINEVQENLEKRAISRSAFMVFLGGIFSILVGFANQMIIAAFFGAGIGMDAYLTALVIPAYLQSVLLTGLSFVFIPIFIREEARGNENTAWELVGTFFWITTGILFALAFIGSYYAKEIIALSAPGFGPEKSALAAWMLSILMLSLPFAGLGSFTRGIQNARNKYFWPAFGGAVNSIGNILIVILLSRRIGSLALAVGFSVAILLQSCITIFPILWHGWPRLLSLNDHRVLEMARLILPFILLGLLNEGTGIFERYFASVLPSGQLSYLGYAGKISSIYQQLLAEGIAVAIFPAMARKYIQDGKVGLEEKTIFGLRLSLATALPVILITGALSIPMVRVLFERGKFNSRDTLNVAQVLLIVLMSGVLCRMLGNIIERTFYVLKDTRTPPVISVFSVLLYIAIGGYCAGQWGYIGLAYATLLRKLFVILFLCLILFQRLKITNFIKRMKNTIVYCLASLGAFFVAKILFSYLDFLPGFVNFCISGLMSGVFYLLILYFHDREIFTSVLEMFGIWRVLDLGKKAMLHLSCGGLS